MASEEHYREVVSKGNQILRELRNKTLDQRVRECHSLDRCKQAGLVAGCPLRYQTAKAMVTCQGVPDIQMNIENHQV